MRLRTGVRQPDRCRFGGGLLAALCLALPAQAAPPVAGRYEALMLAVSSDGLVSGHYREDSSDPLVPRRCSFFLQGQWREGEAAIAVHTWSDLSLPGTLRIDPDGLRLHIAQGRSHAGCLSVLLPAIEQPEGLALGRSAAAPWSGLRVIRSARARLHSDATSASRRGYLVQGDVVGMLAQQGDRLQVQFQDARGQLRSAWIRAADAQPLQPPQPVLQP